MSDDLAQLLRSADGGSAQPDTADIARRGRRLRATRSIAVVVTIAIGATGIVGVALTAGEQRSLPVITEAPPTAPTSDPTEEDPPVDDASDGEQADASQSPADAERDGVLPEIAALPFDVRVGPTWSDPGTQDRVVTDEGVWIVSRPDQERVDTDASLLGDPAGLYGRDYISLIGYGEVLLLDADEREILRAYPFPELAPRALAVTDEAVYCTVQGDGGLPDSMLCRIDRQSMEALVRVFPWDDSSQFLLDPPETYLPDHWVIDEPIGEVLFGDLQIVDGELISAGQDGQTRVDRVTLELLEDDPHPVGTPSQGEEEEAKKKEPIEDDPDAEGVTAGNDEAAALRFIEAWRRGDREAMLRIADDARVVDTALDMPTPVGDDASCHAQSNDQVECFTDLSSGQTAYLLVGEPRSEQGIVNWVGYVTH